MRRAPGQPGPHKKASLAGPPAPLAARARDTAQQDPPPKASPAAQASPASAHRRDDALTMSDRRKTGARGSTGKSASARLRTRARPAAHALPSRPRSARRTPRSWFSRSHSCLKDSAVTMQPAASLPEGPHVAFLAFKEPGDCYQPLRTNPKCYC